jgi:adenylate cyclase
LGKEITMGKSQRHALAIGFAGLVTFLVAFMAEESFHSLDAVSSDMAWRAISEETGGQSERRIVVVNIDEASIERYGPWPWPRELMAKMVARLSEEGVALQVFDVVFPSAKPGNAALAEALAKAPTVLAQIMAIESDETVFRGSLQGGITFPGCAQHFDSATAYIANHTAISAAAAGHITPRISADGGVRRIPAMVCYGDKAYPALVLAAVAEGAAVAPEFSYVQGSGFLDPVARLDFDKIPGLSVPLDAQGDILLPWWLSRSGIVAVSAEAVLEAQLPEGFLSGAWVLIGATAFGVADAVPTPLGGAVSGVEVHAQLMAALLDGRIPYTPRHAGWMQFFWAAFLALVLWAAACYLNRAFLVGVMVTGLGSMAITVVLPVLLLQSFALWLPWVLPATFVFLATGFVLIQQYYSDRRETIVLYRNLSSYLPEHVEIGRAHV